MRAPRRFATIHCNASVCAGEADPTGLIGQNRQVTFTATLRRKPNAFNLYHQIQLLRRLGRADVDEAWAWVL